MTRMFKMLVRSRPDESFLDYIRLKLCSFRSRRHIAVDKCCKQNAFL